MTKNTKSWFNGTELTSSSDKTLSIHHRGFNYGDGIFETMAVQNKTILLHQAHMERLAKGANRLGLDVDISALETQLNKRVKASTEYFNVLKVVLARRAEPGVINRGYPPKTTQTDSIISLTSWEPSNTKARLMACQTPLGHRPALKGLKTLNALEYVLAAKELGNEFDEGVLCDENGILIEGTKSNVFWVDQSGQLKTPRINSAGLAGVMRNALLAKLHTNNIACEQVLEPIDSIENATEIFLTNSIIGVQSVACYKDTSLKEFSMANQCRELLKEVIFEND